MEMRRDASADDDRKVSALLTACVSGVRHSYDNRASSWNASVTFDRSLYHFCCPVSMSPFIYLRNFIYHFSNQRRRRHGHQVSHRVSAPLQKPSISRFLKELTLLVISPTEELKHSTISSYSLQRLLSFLIQFYSLTYLVNCSFFYLQSIKTSDF